MADVIPLRPGAAAHSRGYASAKGIRQLVDGIMESRRAIKRQIELLRGIAELARTIKQLDAEIAAGQLGGVRQVDIEISGGLDLETIAQVAEVVSRQLDKLRVVAEGVEVLKPAVVAGDDGEGETKR